MIVLHAKESKQTTGLAQLLNTTDPEKKQDFSKLLDALQRDGEGAFSKSDLKHLGIALALQDGSDMQTANAKADDTTSERVWKETSILQLLQGEAAEAASDDEIAFLHPKTVNLLDANALRSVVIAAKQSLKAKIETLSNVQQIDIKHYPKTLKGLSELAQKLGVNLEKMTLEALKVPAATAEKSAKTQTPLLDIKSIQKALHVTTQETVARRSQQQGVVNDDGATDNDMLKSALQIKSKEEPKTATAQLRTQEQPITQETVAEKRLVREENLANRNVQEGKPSVEVKTATDTRAQPEAKTTTHSSVLPQTPKTESNPNAMQLQPQPRVMNETDEILPKQEVLRQDAKERVQQSMNQTIQQTLKTSPEPQLQAEAAAKHVMPKVRQSSAERPVQNATSLHVNGETKVATFVVEADTVTLKRPEVNLFAQAHKSDQTLEAVLSESSEKSTASSSVQASDSKQTTLSATDALQPKVELKAKEAQQMLRHFAADMKEAVENYKPPFTRLKMTLNPVKLGEVDVTLIQRGNNVHINVSSNNTALTLLAQNITELKTQLANNGVVNTTMQFSTSHGEHQRQEGQHQQFKEFYKDIEHFSEEEFEQISSMEITLPRYA